MGATLCTCARQSDDPQYLSYRSNMMDKPQLELLEKYYHESSLLQTQSRTETREMLSDEEREAIRRAHHHQFNSTMRNHSAVVAGNETESDEYEYYARQPNLVVEFESGDEESDLSTQRKRMIKSTSDAFRSKLREPIMSPKSKLRLLVEGEEFDETIKNKADKEICLQCSHEETECMDHASAVYMKHTNVLFNDGDNLTSTSPSTDTIEVEPEDNEYFEYIRIIVPPGPCGVVFKFPTSPSMPPTVDTFVPVHNNVKGPIENCGLVQEGSILHAINDLDVRHLPLPEVIRVLALSAHLEREFVFKK